MNNTKNIIPRLFETLAFVLIAVSAIRLIIHVYGYLTYPMPVDDGEGHVLNQAILLSKGELPYPAIQNPPYIVTNYPPLYALLASLFFPFLGEYYISSDVSVFPGLLVTRAISAISGLGICILIYLVSRKSGANKTSAIYASLLFLAMPMVYFWFAIGKPDMLSLFLGVFGLFTGFVYINRGNLLYLTIIPLVLAFFAKQSTVAPFLAILAFLLLLKDKRAIWFTIAYLTSIAGITVILEIATGGEYLRHIVTYTRTQYYIERLWSTWYYFFSNFSLVLILSAYYIFQRFNHKEIKLSSLYFIFAILVSMTSGKIGSDMNYFLESIAAGFIVLSLILTDSLMSLKKHSTRLIIAGFIFLIALDFAFINDNRYASYVPHKSDRESDMLGDREIGSVLISIIKKQDKILSEDEAFSAISGKEVIFNPFIMTELSKSGLWDQTTFVNSIKNMEFDLIILRFDVNNPNHEDKPGRGGHAGWDRWTDEMEAAIRENYRVFATIPLRRQWYLYYPLTPENIKMLKPSSEG